MGMRQHIETIMRNYTTRERLKVETMTERCRKLILKWFGHVERRDQDCVGRKTLEMVYMREEEDEDRSRYGGLYQTRHES